MMSSMSQKYKSNLNLERLRLKKKSKIMVLHEKEINRIKFKSIQMVKINS